MPPTRFLKLPFRPPLAPMLAKLSDEVPEGDGWLHEPKWDGFRAIVFREGDDVELQSRDLKPLARYFPELVASLRSRLPERCIVDGEIVIATGEALDFETLLLRIHPAASRVELLSKETPASFVAWDVLALDGVVSKPLHGTYTPGKRTMVKTKHVRAADCVVTGFRLYKGRKDAVGSLVLGLWDDDGKLVVDVGAGSSTRSRR